MKKVTEIEAWTLDIVGRVESGQPIEDTRVELKTDFPTDDEGWKKWARRIAGHANASLGEPILWIVGVDEKARTVPGVTAQDAASWWPTVQSAFDRVAPDLRDVAVPHGGVTVMALYFTTDRVPFVVKNPKGGSPEFEVPWREGTSTRSATREQLLRILVSEASLPVVEILDLKIDNNMGDSGAVVAVQFYLVPPGSQRVVMPAHRCGAEGATTREFRFESDSDPLGRPMSPLVHVTPSEVVLDGPGRFWVKLGVIEIEHLTRLDLKINLGVAGSSKHVSNPLVFERRASGGRWRRVSSAPVR